MSPVKSPEQHSAGKTNKILPWKDEADVLPPGWIKEVKTRKSGSKTKIDRSYTDPDTGYIFRSLKDVDRYLKTGLKDVRRYLKTGQLGRRAIKRKNIKCVDMDKKAERLHMEERKEQMSVTLRRKRPLDKTGSKFSETGKSELLHHASKRLAAPSPPLSEPKTRQATRLAGIKDDTPSRLLQVPEPKTRQATRLAEVTVDASQSSPSPVEPKTRKATQKAGIKINSPTPSLPDTRTSHLATRQSGVKIDPPLPHQAAQQSPPNQPEPETRQAKHLSGIGDNAPPASLPQLKTRRATRQAGIKIDSPPPSPPDTRNSRQAARSRLVHLATLKEKDKKTEVGKNTNKHDANADMDSNPYHKQETSMITTLVNHENPKENDKEIKTGPATLLPVEAKTPPTSVVPPVDLKKQELPVVNPTVNNPIPQDGYGYGANMKSDSSINFSMTAFWTDPCIEFAVKTLTGAIPCGVENPSPSPLKVPLEELWTDPCIEFAVKTLTGAIPVGEDDHFETGQKRQQQQGSAFGQRSGNIVKGQ